MKRRRPLITKVNEINSEAGDNSEKHRGRGWHSTAGGDINAYEAAGADLLVARRSSIRSRSTSQYLSAESRSMSCSSQPRDSSGSTVFGPGSFAARCSWRLDFARRHLPRRRLAAPVTIVPSFVLSAFISNHNLGAAVTRSSCPLCLNSGGTPKFREYRSPKRDRQKRVFWQFQLRAKFQQSGGRCRCTVKDC